MMAHPYFPAFAFLSAVLLTTALIFFIRYRNAHHILGRKGKRRLPAQQMNSEQYRKKDVEVDVFRWSGTSWAYGLLITLGLVLASINWTMQDKEARGIVDAHTLDVDISVAPPRTAPPPPPPPPPPPQVVLPRETLDIPDYDQPEFQDMSLDADTEVYAPAPVAQVAAPPPPPPPPPPPRKMEEDEIFVVAEDMPRFPGCEHLPTKREKEVCANQALIQFVYQHIEYPPMARETGIDGTVVISFVVEPNGHVSQAQILRDIGGGCGKEALRVVELMNEKLPPWTPGKQRGKAVRVQFNLPVRFMLQN
jgi:protein TonB